MAHLFLPKELSLIAKEKGFDESCFAYYTPLKDWMKKPNPVTGLESVWSRENPNGFMWMMVSQTYGHCKTVKNSEFTKAIYNITAPLYQQIIDWFREKHNIEAKVTIEDAYKDGRKDYNADVYRLNFGVDNEKHWESSIECRSYYEGLNKAIEEAFKLI